MHNKFIMVQERIRKHLKMWMKVIRQTLEKLAVTFVMSLYNGMCRIHEANQR